MEYYNWSEIIPRKSDSELRSILRDRILSRKALSIAENELRRRNDPDYVHRVSDLNELHKNWHVKSGVIHEGICPKCQVHSKFLFTFEQGPRFKYSFFYGEFNGAIFLFTPREILNFLRLRKNRDGKIGTCFECGTITIKCKECGNIQNLEGHSQVCKKCFDRIDKPENFHNPR